MGLVSAAIAVEHRVAEQQHTHARSRHHPSLIDIDTLFAQLPGLIKAVDDAHGHFHWLPLLVCEMQHVFRDQAVGTEVTLLHFKAEVRQSVESNLIDRRILACPRVGDENAQAWNRGLSGR